MSLLVARRKPLEIISIKALSQWECRGRKKVRNLLLLFKELLFKSNPCNQKLRICFNLMILGRLNLLKEARLRTLISAIMCMNMSKEMVLNAR